MVLRIDAENKYLGHKSNAKNLKIKDKYRYTYSDSIQKQCQTLICSHVRTKFIWFFPLNRVLHVLRKQVWETFAVVVTLILWRIVNVLPNLDPTIFIKSYIKLSVAIRMKINLKTLTNISLEFFLLNTILF